MRIGLAGTRTLDGRMLRSGVLRIHKLLRMDEGRKRVLLIAEAQVPSPPAVPPPVPTPARAKSSPSAPRTSTRT